MKKIRMWFYKQAIKDKDVIDIIEKQKKSEAIAYQNWISWCIAHGFPKEDNRAWNDCWQLYDIYYKSEERNAYIQHSSKK